MSNETKENLQTVLKRIIQSHKELELRVNALEEARIVPDYDINLDELFPVFPDGIAAEEVEEVITPVVEAEPFIAEDYTLIKDIDWLPDYFDMRRTNQCLGGISTALGTISRSLKKPSPRTATNQRMFHRTVVDVFKAELDTDPYYCYTNRWKKDNQGVTCPNLTTSNSSPKLESQLPAMDS